MVRGKDKYQQQSLPEAAEGCGQATQSMVQNVQLDSNLGYRPKGLTTMVPTGT